MGGGAYLTNRNINNNLALNNKQEQEVDPIQSAINSVTTSTPITPTAITSGVDSLDQAITPIASDRTTTQLFSDYGAAPQQETAAPQQETAVTAVPTQAYDLTNMNQLSQANAQVGSQGQPVAVGFSYDPVTGEYIEDVSAFGVIGDAAFKRYSPEEFNTKYGQALTPFQAQTADPVAPTYNPEDILKQARGLMDVDLANDLNGDGRITSADALAAAKTQNITTPTAQQETSEPVVAPTSWSNGGPPNLNAEGIDLNKKIATNSYGGVLKYSQLPPEDQAVVDARRASEQTSSYTPYKGATALMNEVNYGVGQQYDSPEEALSAFPSFLSGLKEKSVTTDAKFNTKNYDPSEFTMAGVSPVGGVSKRASQKSTIDYLTKNNIPMSKVVDGQTRYLTTGLGSDVLYDILGEETLNKTNGDKGGSYQDTGPVGTYSTIHVDPESPLNNPILNVLGAVIPPLGLAITGVKGVTGETLHAGDWLKLANAGLEQAGAIKPPSAGAGGMGPVDNGVGLFDTTYEQTQNIMEAAAAAGSDGNPAEILIKGFGVTDDALASIGLDEAAFDDSIVDYTGFVEGVEQAASQVANGDSIEDAIKGGVLDYVIESESDIDLGIVTDAIDAVGGFLDDNIFQPILETVEAVDLGSIEDTVRDLGREFDDEVLQEIKGGIEEFAPQVEDFVKTVGGGVIDVVETAGGLTRDVIETVGGEVLTALEPIGSQLEDIAKATGSTVEDVLKGVAGVGEDILSGVGEVGQDVIDALGPLGSQLEDIARTTGSTVEDVIKGVVDVVETAGGAAVDAVETVGGEVIDVVEAVGGNVVDFVETVGGTVIDTVETVGGGIVTVVETASGEIVNVVEKVGGEVIDALEPIGTAITDIAKVTGQTVEDVLEGVGDIAGELSDEIGDAIKAGGDALEDFITPIGETIEDIAKATGSTVEDVLKGVASVGGEIIDEVGEVGQDVIDALGPLGDTLEDIAKATGSTVGDVLEGVAELTSDVAETIVDVVEPIGKAVEEIAKVTGSTVEDVLKGVGDLTEDLGSGLLDAIETGGQALEDFITPIGETIADIAKATGSTVEDVLKGVASVGEDILGGVGDVGQEVIDALGPLGSTLEDFAKATGKTLEEVVSELGGLGEDILGGVADVGGEVIDAVKASGLSTEGMLQSGFAGLSAQQAAEADSARRLAVATRTTDSLFSEFKGFKTEIGGTPQELVQLTQRKRR